MSKAFTRESDDAPDEPAIPRLAPALPPGARNYLTPDGARRLREELNHLLEVARPKLAASPDKADSGRQLQLLDQRVRQLQQSLETAVVTGPPAATEDRIRFGATVTVRERSGAEAQYRIVGVDETDIDRGWVSWLSPIARALLNARRGQKVRLKLPSGDEELEIVRIAYESGN
jgi:transcription elongation factor GreB